MKFSKSLIAAAAALTLATTAQAEVKSSGLVEIYGRANLSVDMLDDGANYSSTNLSSNASRLGLRGSKKFGNLTGIWQIEQQIEVNLDNSTATNNRLASRDTFAGLRGDFGTVRVGKFDTPFKVARGPFNLFGDEMGDMRNLTRVGAGKFDERLNNMLEYQTPVMNGFQARVAHSFHSGVSVESSNGVEKKKDATSLSLGYKAGNIDATLAYETYGADNALTSSVNGKRDATRAALSYKLSPELSLMGFYQTADAQSGSVNDSADVTGLGFRYMLSKQVALKAQYMDRKGEKANTDAKMYAIGADYLYDKGLSFYVTYASLDNQSGSTAAPWIQGRTTSTPLGVGGQTATGLSVGMRYDF